MEVIADLHLHSKYSRAVSQQMEIPQIALWAAKKGIGLVGTGDWTHPLWLRELKGWLEETDDGGVYRLKDGGEKPLFLLSTEISSIYTQNGKPHRIHNLILAPNFSVVEKINDKLRLSGVNLLSDGRPMTGISSRDLTELVLSTDENCLIVPAHCLLPDENLHTWQGIKAIGEIKFGDKVYTHKNRWQKVKKVFERPFLGKVYRIIPDYFRIGVGVTGEHPFLAIRAKNCPSFNICRPTCSQNKKGCARQYFRNYKATWIRTKDLQEGDILLYPRFTKTKNREYIKLVDYLGDFKIEKDNLVSPGGCRRHKIPNVIKIDKKFCRLTGLFLAEGYTTRDLVSFCFSEKEKEVCEEIKKTMKETFGIKRFKEYKRKNYKAIELTFYSKILHQFFSKFFYQSLNKRRANNKCLPNWMLELPEKLQKEILIGWWQGDKGYTTSRLLMNQMKIICLRLGIIPSIGVDTKDDHKTRGRHDKFENRTIRAVHDTYHFSNLSFFEDKFGLLKMSIFSKFQTKLGRRRGWMDNKFVYLPIRKIKNFDYKGKVYNLETKNDHSYTAEFACIHNCWTPWYSLYGSNSGFDSIKECFGEFADKIYAIETGLSSDPAMNWRIEELDRRSIVSFSDAHSPQKLGREATVFQIEDIKKLRYEDIKRAIMDGEREEGNPHISYTIEFYPEEGKYHYTGHRNCGVKQSPEETKKLGETCSVCGKKLTIGVMHRVEQLGNRTMPASQDSSGMEQVKENFDKSGVRWINDENRPPYVMMVPLMEILSDVFGVGVSSQNVEIEYNRLTEYFGSEFEVLLKAPIKQISKISGEKVAEGILRVREGQVFVDPGYDGVFGKVRIWGDQGTEGTQEEEKQMSLF